MEHVEKEDPGAWRIPAIPGPMIVDMYISRWEETTMGITEEATMDYRLDNNLPGSDDPVIAESTQKRGRTGTMKSEAANTRPTSKRR